MTKKPLPPGSEPVTVLPGSRPVSAYQDLMRDDFLSFNRDNSLRPSEDPINNRAPIKLSEREMEHTKEDMEALEKAVTNAINGDAKTTDEEFGFNNSLDGKDTFIKNADRPTNHFSLQAAPLENHQLTEGEKVFNRALKQQRIKRKPLSADTFINKKEDQRLEVSSNEDSASNHSGVLGFGDDDVFDQEKIESRPLTDLPIDENGEETSSYGDTASINSGDGNDFGFDDSDIEDYDLKKIASEVDPEDFGFGENFFKEINQNVDSEIAIESISEVIDALENWGGEDAFSWTKEENAQEILAKKIIELKDEIKRSEKFVAKKDVQDGDLIYPTQDEISTIEKRNRIVALIAERNLGDLKKILIEEEVINESDFVLEAISSTKKAASNLLEKDPTLVLQPEKFGFEDDDTTNGYLKIFQATTDSKNKNTEEEFGFGDDDHDKGYFEVTPDDGGNHKNNDGKEAELNLQPAVSKVDTDSKNPDEIKLNQPKEKPDGTFKKSTASRITRLIDYFNRLSGKSGRTK